MPKRRSKSKSKGPLSSRAVVSLVLLAFALFAAGEAYLTLRTDRGQLLAARWLHWGDDARVTLLVGKSIRAGLEAAGVPRDSVQEGPTSDSGAASTGGGRATGSGDRSPRVRWRVGLTPDGSLLRTNYAITQSLEQAGAKVIAGHERVGRDGDSQVVLRVGLGGALTHEVVLSKMPREEFSEPAASA